MRRQLTRIVLGLASIGFLAPFATARGAITYFDDGAMPDFPQIWSPQQKNKAICSAASSADCMWYWDTHGFDGLVDRKKNAKTWRDDAEPLVYTMAKYLYNRDPVTDKVAPEGQSSILAGLNSYISQRAKATKTPGLRNLVVDMYQLGKATYKNWVDTINANNTNFGGFEWRDANDTRIAEHSMTGAGVDSDNQRLIVTHGWDDHPEDKPPFKKPPYAARETPYINSYLMQRGNNGRMSIVPADANNVADPDTAELFAGKKYGAAQQMALTEFYSIHPTAAARAALKKAKEAGKIMAGVRTNVAAFDSTYDATVSNDSFAPIYQYIQQVETPIDATSAPAGWQAAPWSSTYTSDITPLPGFGAQPPYEDDPIDQSIPNPVLHGVLWFTTTNPIGPGQDLSGFTFDTSDSFDAMAQDSLSVVSDGRSTYIDSSSDGLLSEAFSPTLLPEPAAAGWIIAAALLLRRRRSV